MLDLACPCSAIDIAEASERPSTEFAADFIAFDVSPVIGQHFTACFRCSSCAVQCADAILRSSWAADLALISAAQLEPT